VELETAGASPVAFVEAALVFEAGMHKKLDEWWWHGAAGTAIGTSNGAWMSEAEARKRMAAQMR